MRACLVLRTGDCIASTERVRLLYRRVDVHSVTQGGCNGRRCSRRDIERAGCIFGHFGQVHHVFGRICSRVCALPFVPRLARKVGRATPAGTQTDERWGSCGAALCALLCRGQGYQNCVPEIGRRCRVQDSPRTHCPRPNHAHHGGDFVYSAPGGDQTSQDARGDRPG